MPRRSRRTLPRMTGSSRDMIDLRDAGRHSAYCNGMKIATYNVNGIKSRISNLLTWLEREQPDIACLQELKAMDSAFPSLAIAGAGYKSVAKGQRSWNGVAILARGMDIVPIRDVLPG